jgi:Na+-transporting NADH:ubiquinone oxidoreductase subunit C
VPKLDSTGYTVGFAAAVSIACATLVSFAAVSLRDRQEANARFFKHKNVLLSAGLVKPEEPQAEEAMVALFKARISARGLDLRTGALVPEDKYDPRTADPRKARTDPKLSRSAPPNKAGIARLPNLTTIYLVKAPDGSVEQAVLPIEGTGMWGAMAGFLALDRDGNTVRGITFYEQKETPGLGGEISNPKWQALWVGRKAYDAKWEPKLTVIKGRAGAPDKDPHRVDALSGATITSNAVAHVVGFWLSGDGYAPYLAKLRAGGSS